MSQTCICNTLNIKEKGEKAAKLIKENLTFRALVVLGQTKTDPELFECQNCKKTYFVDLHEEEVGEIADGIPEVKIVDTCWEVDREKNIRWIALGMAAQEFGFKDRSSIGYITFYHQWYEYEDEAKENFHHYIKDKAEFDRVLQEKINEIK